MSLAHPLGPEWNTAPEKDPSGKDPHEAGAKLDAGKNRLGLVLGGFPRALEQVGRVGTYGANKYSDNGWMHVDSGQQRYMDAMLRHVFKDFTGEAVDPDTGLLHAAHAAWNALAVLELKLRRLESVKKEHGQVTMVTKQQLEALNQWAQANPECIAAGYTMRPPVIGTPFRKD